LPLPLLLLLLLLPLLLVERPFSIREFGRLFLLLPAAVPASWW
jgi:hypothetical protein